MNMSSLTWRGSQQQFTYSASKGGVYALTRSLAMALGKDGIRVNAVAPALIEVENMVKLIPPAVSASRQASAGRDTAGPPRPARRSRRPIAFLASRMRRSSPARSSKCRAEPACKEAAGPDSKE